MQICTDLFNRTQFTNAKSLFRKTKGFFCFELADLTSMHTLDTRHFTENIRCLKRLAADGLKNQHERLLVMLKRTKRVAILHVYSRHLGRI